MVHSQTQHTAHLLPPSAAHTLAAFKPFSLFATGWAANPAVGAAAASFCLQAYTPSRGFVELFCRRCRSSRSSAREECETPSFSLKVAVRASGASSSASSLQRQQASAPLPIGCQCKAANACQSHVMLLASTLVEHRLSYPVLSQWTYSLHHGAARRHAAALVSRQHCAFHSCKFLYQAPAECLSLCQGTEAMSKARSATEFGFCKPAQVSYVAPTTLGAGLWQGWAPAVQLQEKVGPAVSTPAGGLQQRTFIPTCATEQLPATHLF